MHRFRLVGIDPQPFASLFQLSDAALREHDAMRVIATDAGGFPCRISLSDASVGEELLLLPFVHQPAASPYRASGPIFVRRHATRQVLAAGEVPPYVTRRQISLRAYDAAHRIVDASLREGPQVAAELERMFNETAVAYVHLHNANRGCFSCAAERV